MAKNKVTIDVEVKEKGFKKGDFAAFDYLDRGYVEKNPGLYCHTNVVSGKWDMYPHPKLIDILKSF